MGLKRPGLRWRKLGPEKTAEYYTPRRADEGFCSDRPLVQPAPLPTMTESLAEALSKEGNDQLTYDSALRAVSKLDSWKMDSPDFATFDKRVVEFKDLPLKLAHSRPTKLTHIVDVVEDMDDNVDRGRRRPSDPRRPLSSRRSTRTAPRVTLETSRTTCGAWASWAALAVLT